VSLPEADDPDLESLGIAGHWKCAVIFAMLSSNSFKRLEREKQDEERFRSKSFSAGPSASSWRSFAAKEDVRISVTGKEMLTARTA